MSLKSNKILITAGPTWVAIDRVRVISNLATGATGFILADKLKKYKFGITLLLGPGNYCPLVKGIRLIRFKYFSELVQLLDKELKSGQYAAVIHAAAVADYRPKKIIQHKISSQRKSLKLDLVPTRKLIYGLKRFQPDLLTVGFKFEPDAQENGLIRQGKGLLKKADLDFVVANSNLNNGYQAYILGGLNNPGPFLTKAKMATCLAGLIKYKL